MKNVRVRDAPLTYCHAADESSTRDAGFHYRDVGGELVLKDTARRGGGRERNGEEERERGKKTKLGVKDRKDV